MQKYKVIVTWEAVYDIAEIADYIEAQFGIARADRFQEEIKERLDKLKISGGISGKHIYVIVDILFTRTHFHRLLFFTLLWNQKKKSMS